MTGMIRDSTMKEFLAIRVNSSGITKVRDCLDTIMAHTHRTANSSTTLFSNKNSFAFLFTAVTSFGLRQGVQDNAVGNDHTHNLG